MTIENRGLGYAPARDGGLRGAGQALAEEAKD